MEVGESYEKSSRTTILPWQLSLPRKTTEVTKEKMLGARVENEQKPMQDDQIIKYLAVIRRGLLYKKQEAISNSLDFETKLGVNCNMIQEANERASLTPVEI